MPLYIWPPMLPHLSSTEVAPGRPASPCGPRAPSGPRMPTTPWDPTLPVMPSGPLSPSLPIGPSAPSRPMGPCAPSTPFSPLMPFAPAQPRAPPGPSAPVVFSLAIIWNSNCESEALSASFMVKSFSAITSLSHLNDLMVLSTRAMLRLSSTSRRATRAWFSLSFSFCAATASRSSTGHMGQPAGATPTLPKRMIVGGGGMGSGAV
mmetsp:Transcript_36710/g.86915  ORF Transcript_36710/g.86915 Transcript_36710/m.86915 type:complete len:206 (-) Transcript_36710:311-928(-)